MPDSRFSRNKPHQRRAPLTRTRRRRRVAILGALGVLVLLAVWALVEPHVLLVERTVLSSPDVPPEFEGARIVFVADIHAGPFFSRERLTDLVARINAEKPDVVILGGDYASGGSANEASFVYPELGRLSATHGVFAVLGNHDVWAGRDASAENLSDAGITLLDNDNVRITNGSGWIRVAGVDDAWSGRPQIELASADIARDEFSILVSHTPDYFATALPRTRGAFDLALGAHTHGGQVTVFGLWSPVMPTRFGQRYRGGWTAEEGVPILVTRGVGMTDAPVRFFAPPQYHVIQLHRGQAGVRTL